MYNRNQKGNSETSTNWTQNYLLLTLLSSDTKLCASPILSEMKQRGILIQSVPKLKPIASSRKVLLPRLIKQSKTYNENEYTNLIHHAKKIQSEESLKSDLQLKQLKTFNIELSQPSSTSSYSINSFDASTFHDNGTTEIQQALITCYKVQQSINELNMIATKVHFLQSEMQKIEKRVVDAYQALNTM